MFLPGRAAPFDSVMRSARAKHLMPCRSQVERRRIITQSEAMLRSSGTTWLSTRRSCSKPNELLDLRDDESFRRDATHRLADDALRRNQITRALDYARELDGSPKRDFSDRLLLLSTLKAAGDGETQSLLEQIKKEASNDAMKIGALIGWMNSQKMSVEAVAWIKTLPPTMLAKRTAPLNVAEAFMATSDWDGLRKFCAGTKWDALDYMRNVLAARALREVGQVQESSQEWKEAVAKVGTRSEQIFGLAELARKWGWQNQALDLW